MTSLTEGAMGHHLVLALQPSEADARAWLFLAPWWFPIVDRSKRKGSFLDARPLPVGCSLSYGHSKVCFAQATQGASSISG